jgi:CheY-like chemotaxis protein
MSRKTVLLVDDDEVFVEAVSAILESRYEVRTASNGTEAMKSVQEFRPDLIVLDVMMDHISEGFDVARKLRTNDDTKEIPIIMLTGVDEVYNYRMEIDESWVPNDRYLEKPVSPPELLTHIDELLG